MTFRHAFLATVAAAALIATPARANTILPTPQIDGSGNLRFPGGPILGHWDGTTWRPYGVAGFTPGQFYVATAANGGSDSNDCLAATVTGAHGPCLTIQHAVNLALSYDMNSGWAYINIGPGTFAGALISGAMRGAGGPAISGAYLVLAGAGASTIVTPDSAGSADIAASDHATVIVQTLNLQIPTGVDGLFSQNAAVLQVGNNVTFTGQGPNATAEHVEGEALIEHATGLTLKITGQFGEVLTAGVTGYIEFDPGGGTIDLTGLTSFDNFDFVGDLAVIFHGSNWTFTNGSSATGRPYYINRNGLVRNDGAALPGNVKGWVETGGRYTPTPTPSLVNFSSGLGTGGTAAFSGKAGSHGGRIVLTTGSASTGSAGSVQVNTAEYNLDSANNPAPCTASLSSGSANWAAGAALQMTANAADALVLAWNNAGIPLAPGATYQITYGCTAD